MCLACQQFSLQHPRCRTSGEDKFAFGHRRANLSSAGVCRLPRHEAACGSESGPMLPDFFVVSQQTYSDFVRSFSDADRTCTGREFCRLVDSISSLNAQSRPLSLLRYKHISANSIRSSARSNSLMLCTTTAPIYNESGGSATAVLAKLDLMPSRIRAIGISMSPGVHPLQIAANSSPPYLASTSYERSCVRI